MNYRNSPRFTPIFSWIVFIVFAILIAVEIHGFATAGLFGQLVWYPVGLTRFIRYTGFFVAWCVPLLLFAPWAAAGLIAALAAGFTLAASGPQALLATLFFVLSASALGHRVIRSKQNSLENDVCAVLCGFAIYVFLMTCAARLPVNYPALWAVIVALPLALDARGSAGRLAFWGRSAGGLELRQWKERAAFALLAFVLLMHWLVALKPETGSDALAMHLAIPADIAANHRLAYEPAQFLWSVMPMGADMGYSIVYLLGGEAASRLLNFSMLLLALALMYFTVRRMVARSTAFLLVALFASTSLVQLVTGSLFVENVLAALILGALTAMWRYGDTGAAKFLYLAALLAGTAAATKLGSMAFLVAALPFAVWELRRQGKTPRLRPGLNAAGVAAIFLAAALPPYVIAYHKTGNPFFPFLNLKFPSPLLDRTVDIRDFRYRERLTWTTLYDLTFYTHRFFEGLNGAFGFQNLVLAPLALLSLAVARNRRAICAAVVALAAAFCILRAEPNARYAYVAMPLIVIPFAALLEWMAARRRWMFQALIAFAVVCTAINAWFAPASGWEHKEFYAPAVFLPHGRERYIHDASPIRDVEMYFSRAHPHGQVLLESDSDVTDAPGRVHEYDWHEYGLLMKIRNAHSLQGMLDLVQRENIGYFIGRKHTAPQFDEPSWMQDLFTICADPEYANGAFYLARLDPACVGLDAAGVEARVEAHPPAFLLPGAHDDFEPALLFRGNWIRDVGFKQPFQQTISYSWEAGSRVVFAFEGRALTYVFTKAPNRGIAEVVVDGVLYRTVDLYSPGIEWQSKITIGGFEFGRHVAVVRVTGRRNPKATAEFVDLDCVVIE